MGKVSEVEGPLGNRIYIPTLLRFVSGVVSAIVVEVKVGPSGKKRPTGFDVVVSVFLF